MEIAADSLDGSVIFHAINEISGFVLYMHQQIPSLLQDITLEFDSLCSEYKESEMALHQNEVKPTLRRKHAGQMREAKRGIRRFQKLMRQVSDLQTALKLMISEVPHFQEAILVIGASPLRPHHVYELSFSSASAVPSSSGEHEHEKELDFGKSRAAEVLCRKAIRGLISKGAGCASYSGPSKLFLLVKAPPCLNLPPLLNRTESTNQTALSKATKDHWRSFMCWFHLQFLKLNCKFSNKEVFCTTNQKSIWKKRKLP